MNVNTTLVYLYISERNEFDKETKRIEENLYMLLTDVEALHNGVGNSLSVLKRLQKNIDFSLDISSQILCVFAWMCNFET